MEQAEIFIGSHWENKIIFDELFEDQTEIPSNEKIYYFRDIFGSLSSKGMLRILPHSMRYSILHVDSDLTDNLIADLHRRSLDSSFKSMLNNDQVGAIVKYITYTLESYPKSKFMFEIFNKALTNWSAD